MPRRSLATVPPKPTPSPSLALVAAESPPQVAPKPQPDKSKSSLAKASTVEPVAALDALGEAAGTPPPWPAKKPVASDDALTSANKDEWLGQLVMIMQGATKGRVARVVGSSAGWVNVRMADEDGNEPSEADASLVKAKRAVDLNLLLGHGLKTREDAAAFGSTPPEVAEKRPYKRHKTLLSQVQAAEANADSAASGNDEDAAAETARKSKRASVSAGWLKKRVYIADADLAGTVVRSGHGFFTVLLSNGDEVMRRKEELQIIEGDDALPKELGQGLQAKSAGGEEAGEEGKAGKKKRMPMRRKRNQQKAFGQGGASSDARSRMEATRRMRQEMIAQYLVRAVERMERQMGVSRRPDLADYLDKIQGQDEDEDEYTAPLFPVAFCATCKLEKEAAADACWNMACWESPVYTPGAAPLSGDALPKRNANAFAVLTSPRRAGFLSPKPDRAASAHAASANAAAQLPKYESRFTAGKKRAENQVVVSPLVSFAYRAPVRWLGVAAASWGQAPGYFGPGWVEAPVARGASEARCPDVDPGLSFLDLAWANNNPAGSA